MSSLLSVRKQDGDKDVSNLIDPLLKEIADLESKLIISPADAERINFLQSEVARAIQNEMGDGTEANRGAGTSKLINEVLINDLETYKKTWAEADTNLFFSGWSSRFAHGADTMMPIVRVAEQLMRPGERIDQILRINWRKLMVNNFRVQVVEGDFAEKDQDDCVLDGAFKLDSGRKLSFCGIEDYDRPIMGQRNRNPFAEGMVCACPSCVRVNGDKIAVKLTPPRTFMAQEVGQIQPVYIATLLELVNLALVNLASKQASGRAPLRLLGGFKNVDIPYPIERLFWDSDERLVLTMDTARTKIGNSELELTPFYFSFPGGSASGEGFVAQAIDDDQAEDYCQLNGCAE